MKKRYLGRHICPLYQGIGMLLSTCVWGGQIQYQFSFKTQDIAFSSLKGGLINQTPTGYNLVSLKGYGFIREPGSPMLPEGEISAIIPPSAIITGVQIISVEAETLSGRYEIYPAQPPRPLSKIAAGRHTCPLHQGIPAKWVSPSYIYSQALPFPEKLVTHSHTANMGGYRIAGFLVHPLQYIPSEKKLIFNSKIEIQITYTEGSISNVTAKTLKEKSIFQNIIKDKVINPSAVEQWAPPIKYLSKSTNIEYVIITTDSFVSAFQSLADWKTKKGVPAAIVTVDSIYANCSGTDNAEKIRNFIKDANSQWGTIWFLLGGQCDYENDQEIISRRDVYYMESGAGYYPDEDTIPSDLYFSDLDGSWDANGNGVYGESSDSIDFAPDVFVGRAPVRTIAHVQTFVNKVLTYEKNPPAGYLKSIVLPAIELWTNYQGDEVNNAIADILPAGWQATKLYESDGSLSTSAVQSAINSGIGFCHIAAHGDENGTYYADGNSVLSSDDIASLTNGDKLGIMNAISCFSGAVDEVSNGDCFAELFVLKPNGGVVASIMNSRYGWGTPPQLGGSEVIDTSLYHELFLETYQYHDNLGVAHATSKSLYISMITWGSQDVLPWCIYELNLFGDPELSVWTDEPQILSATHPSTIPIGLSSFQVTVKSGGSPVANARVCVVKTNEVYVRAYTNASGVATVQMSPSPASLGTLSITCTASNYKPYEGQISIISATGPYVMYKNYEIDDDMNGNSIGNNDGIVEAGERIELPITLQNVGQNTASGVVAQLSLIDNSYVTLMDSIKNYGNMLFDSSGINTFLFDVKTNVPDNYDISFQITIKDVNDSSWAYTFSVPVPVPVLKFQSYSIKDDIDGGSVGDGDEFPERGETVGLGITLENTKDIPATNITATISTQDTFITIIDSLQNFGNVDAYGTATSFGYFHFWVKPWNWISQDQTVKLHLNIHSSNRNWTDSLNVKIASPGDTMYSIDKPSTNTHGLAYDGENLWVSDNSATQISAVNPSNGTIIKTISSPGGSGSYDMAWGNKVLWVHQYTQHKIYEIDTNGTVLKSFNSPATQNSTGIAYDGEFLWVSSSRTIYKVDTSGTTISNFTVSISGINNRIRGLAFEPNSGNLLFLMSFAQDSSKVYEITKSGTLVATHSFQGPLSSQGRAVEYDPVSGDYWVADYSSPIYKVEGFYPWPPKSPPRISIYPDSLGATILDTASQVMRITNAGFDTLTFSISKVPDVGWLSISPAGNSLANGKYENIVLAYNASGLVQDSTYFTSLHISSNDPQNPLVEIPCNLTVKIGVEEKDKDNTNNVSAYPNPFTQSTVISFHLPTTKNQHPITICIYDLAGRVVRTFPINRSSKTNKIVWDRRDNSGRTLGSGVYFYSLKTENCTITKKMVLVR